MAQEIEYLRLEIYQIAAATQFAAIGVKRIVFKEVAHDVRFP
jgi:hypothetical protein